MSDSQSEDLLAALAERGIHSRGDFEEYTGEDLRRVGNRLAELFPPPTRRRGWTVINLTHGYERTSSGVEEVWSCEIVGPNDIDVEWHQFSGRPRSSTFRILTGTIGSAYSTTEDGLVEMVKGIVDQLGIADLKDPA